MTTNTNIADQYESDVANADADILGNVVWCHVRDARIPRGDAKVIAEACGIDPSYLPNVPALSDVFRRATSESSGVKQGRYTYLVRKVSDKGGVIIRHIIREERDEQGKRLGYDKVGEITFRNDAMHCEIIANDAKVSEIVQTAEAKFDSYRDNITGEEVHRMVKKMLDQMSRVSVHPTGGVYFVPVFYRLKLRSLRCFVKRIDQYATGEGRADQNVFSIVPLPNMDEHREDVAAAFNSAFRNEVESAVTELADILRDSENTKPSESIVSAKAGQLAALQTKLADYKSVIGEAIDEASFRIDLFADQVEQLAGLREVKFAESAYAEAANNAVDGLQYEAKSSYTTMSYKGRVLGRVRFSRAGVAMYTGIDLSGHSAAGRDEYEAAGQNGYKIVTDEPDVFALFVKALADNAGGAPVRKSRIRSAVPSGVSVSKSKS